MSLYIIYTTNKFRTRQYNSLHCITLKNKKTKKTSKTSIMIQQKMMRSSTQMPADLVQQLQESQAKYRSISQIAMYSTLTNIEAMQIFTRSTCDVQCNIVFCYHAQKFVPELRKQITYFIVRTFNQEIPKLKNKFSIAYVHNGISDFLFFRNIVRILPAKFLGKMKQFYIVHAGFGVKFVEFMSFGEVNSYLKSKTRHIDRVDQIQASKKLTLGGDVVTKSRLNNQNSSSPYHQSTSMPTKEFQSSDAKLIRNKLYGKELSDYRQTSSGIPEIIWYLLMHLWVNSDMLKYEGIMRKSCDVQELEILQNKIIQNWDGNGTGWKKFVDSHTDPYVICGCVKKIFNNLNTPLFSYQLYDQMMPYRSDGHIANDLQFFSSILNKMPSLHRHVLFFTTFFLKYGIIANQQFNKMSAYNLAVVFGPCFFRPKQYRLEDLMTSGKFSFFIKMLLQNYQELIGHQGVEKYKEMFTKHE